jgi:hypothetical protein
MNLGLSFRFGSACRLITFLGGQPLRSGLGKSVARWCARNSKSASSEEDRLLLTLSEGLLPGSNSEIPLKSIAFGARWHGVSEAWPCEIEVWRRWR